MCLRLLVTFFISYTVVFSSFVSADSLIPNANKKAVACLISDQTHVLLVKEIVTNKYALPGGGVEQGETYRQAVEREVLEETGLTVSAHDVIFESDVVTFFSCVPDKPITAFEVDIKDDFYLVPNFDVAHYGIEINGIYLVKPFKIKSEEYRFPDELPIINELYRKYAHDYEQTDIVWVDNLAEQASPIHKMELSLLLSLREGINKLPDILSFVTKLVLTLLNPVTQSFWIYCIFLFALISFGRNVAFSMLFAILFSVICSIIIKQSLEVTRPFFYIPHLQLANAVGYGMPSIDAMLSTIMCALFYLGLKREKQCSPSTLKKWKVAFISLLFIQSIARFWLGVNFITNIIAGIALGLLIIAILLKLEKRYNDKFYLVMSSGYFWIAFSLLISGIGWMSMNPTFLYVMAVSYAITFAIMLCRSNEVRLLLVRERVTLFIVLSIMVFAIQYATSDILLTLKQDSLHILSVRILSHFVSTFFVVLLVSWLPLLSKHKKIIK